MVWSFALLLLLNALLRTWRGVAGALRDPLTRRLLMAAAALVTANWGTYIFAVNSTIVIKW